MVMVRELMDPVYRTWKEDVIEWMFYEFEASIIKNIPLYQSIQDDVLIWPFNPNGEYLVKSKYKFLHDAQLRQQQGPSNFEPMKPLWRKIWNLGVANKVKHLVWRACRDSIPTKVNLVKRKILVDDLCEACKQHKEDIVHALYRCPLLEPLWRHTPMWNHDALKRSTSFTDIIEFVFSGDKEPELFTSVIWNLLNR
nr:putative ribonuclease h protein [Quercus suber]